MSAQVKVSTLQRKNKAFCSLPRLLANVEINNLCHVPAGKLTQNDWLLRHSVELAFAAEQILSRRPAKYAASAMPT